ncbi:hypothetical protein Asppvi_009336 [Aspergillus pseudoviridinutans]|uniref:Sulfotransferase family protein n=1 Tax=Aspergillus pseudoviridinutans TaxID=1517512 RepID=A0A9P3EYC6_9EURO|nr:uncharacterized protein Asppvi_009336 [Aspergillus pseudoviridinutans]GIJ90382.1 hypothetical protein Asppvi_009336 [Aspergillus pseudoviridinutans]
MQRMMLDLDQDPNLFTEAYQGQCIPDWDKVFEKHDAAVGWPSAAFWEQLVEKYPDAKVILTVRDAESWYDSMEGVLNVTRASADFDLPKQMADTMAMIRAIIKNGVLKNFDDRKAMIEDFHARNELIKRTVSPDRLLVFKAQDGWEPLCKFLGVDVPPLNVSYPHANKREDMLERTLYLKEKLEKQMVDN